MVWVPCWFMHRFFSDAENLRSKRCGQENVASLNISMDLLPIMQVLQALQHLQGFTHLGRLAAPNRDLEPSNRNPTTRRSTQPGEASTHSILLLIVTNFT